MINTFHCYHRWYTSSKEYGTYERSYRVNESGRRAHPDNRDRTWIHHNMSFICKLRKGLTKKGLIRSTGHYRREVEYEVRRTWGQLDGKEKLDYEDLDDGLTIAEAQKYMGRQVARARERDEDETEETLLIGTVSDVVTPRTESRDRRLLFRIVYGADGDEEDELVTLEDLNKMFN